MPVVVIVDDVGGKGGEKDPSECAARWPRTGDAGAGGMGVVPSKSDPLDTLKCRFDAYERCTGATARVRTGEGDGLAWRPLAELDEDADAKVGMDIVVDARVGVAGRGIEGEGEGACPLPVPAALTRRRMAVGESRGFGVMIVGLAVAGVVVVLIEPRRGVSPDALLAVASIEGLRAAIEGDDASGDGGTGACESIEPLLALVVPTPFPFALEPVASPNPLRAVPSTDGLRGLAVGVSGGLIERPCMGK